jgi:hypothetical protein
LSFVVAIFLYGCNGVGSIATNHNNNPSIPTHEPNPSIPNVPSTTTSGVLYFHAFVPESDPAIFQDTMNLSGDRYTDLIMSNYIAGVVLGQAILESFPNMQFNKDYLYGTIFGQLLQENIATQLYESNLDLIAPDPSQQSVMGIGQGGPYQINAYAYDLIGGNSGYSLAHYTAIQKNIGYTLEQESKQSSKQTPAQFNNKYYGPMLTAFFHINDVLALETLDNGSLGWVGPAPNSPQCMINLGKIANSPLDIIDNYSYNQGFYGGLVKSSTDDCVNLSADKFLAIYNSYSNSGIESDSGIITYKQYPYQVRFYLDQIYNNSSLVGVIPVHIAFNLSVLGSVFTNTFTTLAYIDQNTKTYQYINATDANNAYNSALTTLNLSNTTILDLSDATQRNQIFTLLETAIQNLTKSLNIKFTDRTFQQL